jgi:hypothetical protein
MEMKRKKTPGEGLKNESPEEKAHSTNSSGRSVAQAS